MTPFTSPNSRPISPNSRLASRFISLRFQRLFHPDARPKRVRELEETEVFDRDDETRAELDLTELVSLAQVASELPCRRGGRKTHVATLYRWTTHGCRGVKLRFSQVGATRCTTREWLAEFFDRLTMAASGEDASPKSRDRESVRTPAARRQAAERAGRELQRLGA